MIWIQITGEVDGGAHLYEQLRRPGQRRRVPTYAACASLEGGTLMFRFSVTRDASDIVFGYRTERFGVNGECPPSRLAAPYHGVIHQSPNIPFGIRLFDANCARQQHLRGETDHERSYILLHHGPARSEGCFIIAGGKRGFSRWRTDLKHLQNAADSTAIRVQVDPRPESHHTRHLSR